LSKIDARGAAGVRAPFDLQRLLEDLAGTMMLRAEKKGLRMAMELDSALPRYIRTDAPKLRQILINLLGNAIKFTEKGRVTLRARRQGGAEAVRGAEGDSRVRLEFEVEDTGIGIPPEDRARIFEPFVQVKTSRKPSGGVGLGLAISKKLTDLLGGEISLRSEVGRGSVFVLSIAVERVEDTDIPGQAVVRRVTGLAPGQSSYRLLVVDDNLESRLLLRQLLEPVGFKVLEAAGGQEAIDLFRKDPPHLVWMDIRMPEMDGYEAARRIREAESGRRGQDGRELHTPIIAFTAGAMESKESSPLSGVFDDWVYKPFREEEIFAKIESHLGVRFLYREVGSAAGREGNIQDSAAFSPADLAHLPGDWLEEFSRALKTGWPDRLLTMIDRIPPEHAHAARVLGELVRMHQFDELVALAQGALKEKADG
jgi:two-component system sensor histidine kinase/response regulator